MIHPYKFKLKWRLTWDQMSEATGRDRRTLLRYRTKSEPDDTIQILCQTLDMLWQSPGFMATAKELGLFVPPEVECNESY